MALLTMGNQKILTEKMSAFPATEALANRNEAMMRQGLGFGVDVSSLLLVNDHHLKEDLLFPRFELNSFATTTCGTGDHYTIAPKKLLKRKRRTSPGLVRSKPLLCLPSAAQEMVRRKEKKVRSRKSGSLLAAAKQQHAKSLQQHALLPTPDCLKRNSSPSTFLTKMFVNSKIQEHQDMNLKPITGLVDLPPLFTDCPFPALSIPTTIETINKSCPSA